MPGLTITEKNHGKDRIAARIDKAVERIKSRYPALFHRVQTQAHAEALASLGLAQAHADLESIRVEESVLDRRKKRAQRVMLATLRGVPLDEVADGFSLRYGGGLPLPAEAAEAITRRQAVHHDRLLADDPIGREIARLLAEKDVLLDTIWLATSTTQIKQLWTRVVESLGDEPTALEREALSIEPIAEA